MDIPVEALPYGKQRVQPQARHVDAIRAYYEAHTSQPDTPAPLPGMENHYFSKYPHVREAQFKCLAHALAMQEARLASPPMTQEEQEAWHYETLMITEQRQREALKALGQGIVFKDAFACNDQLIKTEALKTVREFIKSDKTFLLLLGGTGTGKTFAAITGMTELMSKRTTAQGRDYWDGILLSHDQLADMVLNESRYKRKDVLNTKTLMIDDLKTNSDKKQTEAFCQWIDHLIDHRYKHGKTTIITSNATMQDFVQTYGQRVLSRIKSQGTAYGCTGNDLRLED